MFVNQLSSKELVLIVKRHCAHNCEESPIIPQTFISIAEDEEEGAYDKLGDIREQLANNRSTKECF